MRGKYKYLIFFAVLIGVFAIGIVGTEKKNLRAESENTTADFSELQAQNINLQKDDTYKYVAIGNSVTIHDKNELWPGNWGMAATAPEKDYVHVLSRLIEQDTAQQVETTVLSCKEWELSAERENMLSEFESIPEDADLITIQTGENVTLNMEEIEKDYRILFNFIRLKAPDAQILVLGEILWPNPEIEQAKQNFCAECNMKFINMDEFLNGYDMYKSYLGENIVGEDGSIYTITNDAVAAHPNDAGMQKIAEIIYENINISYRLPYVLPYDKNYPTGALSE